MIPVSMVAASVLKGSVEVAQKAIEVAIPVVKKAGHISLRFIEGGVAAVRDDEKVLKLSEPSHAIDNNLSLPGLFFEEQEQLVSSVKIANEQLALIHGQNELMFLSNSIQYFIQSHKDREGIDRSISFALQYDILAAANQIKANEKLRFPGYLHHMCDSLARTIREYNRLYDALLNDGYFRTWSLDDAKEKMARTLGPGEVPDFSIGYIPYDLQITIRREYKEALPTLRRLPIPTMPTEFVNNPAHDSLFVLLHELAANESLEMAIYEKLERFPSNKLVVAS